MVKPFHIFKNGYQLTISLLLQYFHFQCIYIRFFSHITLSKKLNLFVWKFTSSTNNGREKISFAPYSRQLFVISNRSFAMFSGVEVLLEMSLHTP